MGAGAAFAGASILQAGSGIMSSINDYEAGRQQANQYKLQSQQLELQKDIITDQYRTKRNQLQGTAIARAGHSGVKVSGSVAQSISTSLTEMGMEESYKKFNINGHKGYRFTFNNGSRPAYGFICRLRRRQINNAWYDSKEL